MRSRPTPALASAGRVAAAMLIMNVATFVFNMIAARLTIPSEFGALSAMLGILMIASVVSLAIQATTARRLAVHPETTDHTIALTARVTWLTALSVGALVGASTVVLTPVLRLDSPWPVLLCGAAVVPLTVYGGQAGVAQGTSQWTRLGWLYAAHGVGRLGLGTLALLVAPTATSAMVGVALAAWLPVLVGRGLLAHQHASPTSRDAWRFTTEAWLAGSTLLGFLVLTNLDALMSRATLDPHDSGLYAAGLILTKSTLFLPQFVSVILYPRMARDSTGRSQFAAVGFVAALGLVVVAGAAVLPQVTVMFVGGHDYDEVSTNLWVFALVGTAQAVLNILMFGAIARRTHVVTVIVWTAVAVLVTVTLWRSPSLLELIVLVGVTCTIAAASLAMISLRLGRTGSALSAPERRTPARS